MFNLFDKVFNEKTISLYPQYLVFLVDKNINKINKKFSENHSA